MKMLSFDSLEDLMSALSDVPSDHGPFGLVFHPPAEVAAEISEAPNEGEIDSEEPTGYLPPET